MRVLVTGGARYNCSHTLFKLMEQGHGVCMFDNFFQQLSSCD